MAKVSNGFKLGSTIVPIRILKHVVIRNNEEWPTYIDPADIVHVLPSRFHGNENDLHVWWISYSLPNNVEEDDNEA